MSFAPRAALALSLSCALGTALAADLPPPPKVNQQQALTPQGALLVSLGIDKMKVSLTLGDEMGHGRTGWFCGNPVTLRATDAFVKSIGASLSVFTVQELKRLGYPLANRAQANAFDVDINSAPDFRVGAILTEAKHELCIDGAKADGWTYYKINWALFSEKQQRVVYQAVTEGLGFSAEKVTDLNKRALASSLANFLAAPAFLEALQAKDAAPAAAAASSASAPETTTGLTTMKGVPVAGGGAQKNQAQLRNAVVTLETASGSGSGFFIDKEGHLLTNAHVVSGSKYARVKLQNGDKAVAEVIKINEQADVALLKTALTDGDALALRNGAPLDVGSDVYAIGSPMGVLNNSMTRGVLSADRVLQGRRVLQSDAAVTFGSSGGPLLDSDGRVIAITRGGVAEGKGFNFFIPIDVALKALQISVTP